VAKLTAKGRETRERIVSVAADLMQTRGVAGTSTQHVEAAAGVSSSQIYHYFASKDELIMAVINFQADRIVSVHEGLLEIDGGMRTLEAWRGAVIEMQVTYGFEAGCPLGSLASELSTDDPTARIQLAYGFRRWETAIGNVLHSMHTRGELRPDADPAQLALALLTALQGGLLLSQTRQDTLALEAGLHAVLERIRQSTVPAPAGLNSSSALKPIGI
jgi:TetR/AcrR family transcriptional repressor of nem operon